MAHLAGLVLGQVGEAPCPVAVPIGRDDGGIHHFAVGQQIDGDALRTQAVPVVVIIPCLAAGDVDGLRSVGVGDVVVADGGGVVGCIGFAEYFLDGVGQLMAHLAGLVLGQVGEAPCPVAVPIGRDGGRIHHFAVGQQIDGDALRTQAVPVVVIIPCLAAGNVDGLRSVGVGYVVAGDGGRVVGRICFAEHFLDGVGQLMAHLARFILGQVGEAPCPVAVLIRRDSGGIHHFAVGQQIDGDALRTHAVPVVVIIPCFAAGDVDGLRSVGVGDVVVADGGGVAFHRIFGNRIDNRGSGIAVSG